MKNLKSIIFYSICVLVSTRLLNAKGYVELKNGFCHPSHRDGKIYTTPYCLSGEIGYSFHVWRFGIQINQYNPSLSHFNYFNVLRPIRHLYK